MVPHRRRNILFFVATFFYIDKKKQGFPFYSATYVYPSRFFYGFNFQRFQFLRLYEIKHIYDEFYFFWKDFRVYDWHRVSAVPEEKSEH
jgi:hypothetical protein